MEEEKKQVEWNEENETNAILETYDDDHFEREHWQKDRMEKIIKFCLTNKPPFSKLNDKPLEVLDVGSADGYLADKLIKVGYKVIPLDLSPTRIRRMKEIYGIEGVLGDIREIPFPDKTFDIVIAAEILEHLNEMWKGMKEIERVSKDDGLIVISVPIGEEHDSFILHKWAIRKNDVEFLGKPDMVVFSLKKINRTENNGK